MSTESFIQFKCPECGKHLRVEGIQVGKSGKCPKCNAKLRVPDVRGESSKPRIHFKCPECGKAIVVLAEYAGKRGKCPKCETLIRIPNTPEKVDEEPLTEDSKSMEATSKEVISGDKAPRQETPKNPLHKRDISLRLPIVGVILLGLSGILIGLVTGNNSIIKSGIIPFLSALILLIPTALMQIMVHWFYGFKPRFGVTYACYLLGYIVINITIFLLFFILILAFPNPNISTFNLGLFVSISWFILTASVCGNYLNDPEKGPIGFWKACLPLFIVLLILFFACWLAAFIFLVRGS